MHKSFALAEVKALAETDEAPFGAFEAILNAPTKDRDGEVIDGKAFVPLPRHIGIDIDHGLTTTTLIGSGEPYYDGDTLKVRGTFSSIPRAQEVRTLVTEGHLSTMSVAFVRATRDEKDGTPHVTKAELLNASFVPVPSNREAAVLMVKSWDEKAGARNSARDAATIQGMHDGAVSLGADCGGAKSHDAEETKDPATTITPATEPVAEEAPAESPAVVDAADTDPVDDAGAEEAPAEPPAEVDEALMDASARFHRIRIEANRAVA